MTRLPLSHVELSEVIGQIYSATLTRCWDDFLERIIDITQSNKAFFLLQKLSEPQPALLNLKINFDYDPDVLRDYYRRPEQDPLYQLIKDFPEGEVIYCNEYFDVDDFSDTEYFQSIYKPMRTYHALGCILLRDGVYDSNFIINRGPADKPYSELEKQLLKILTPHLNQAVRIFNTLQLQREYIDLNQSIMDQAGKAIFVCNRNAEVLIKNAAAEQILASDQLFVVQDGQLQLSEKLFQARFSHYVNQCADFAIDNIYCKEALIVDRANGSTATISIMPLRGCHDFTRLPQQVCLVTVCFSHTLDWELLTREFQLTRAESRLISALYRKKKLSDLSQELNLSYNTLRSQLQTIFKKLHVNSQAELMVKLNSFADGGYTP
ncbi:MAG: hypothetical protein KKE30_19055 [Gammaproteobacteria bacterium]|nr:hypothetical protein [Gammaproteobacteria bacterium]MBU1556310.1 hypothetical protein [Gammaproteobacteria bacterium]MBU2071714.1 hypothetical protein [Gammaproteobacteria bacterium]MBU2182381.1 hypothetical protein [Gammaproteobacteria bacterium]MBU2203560.1 hypothetical protein [Gammaproteobacteria bacterium]